MEGVAGHVYDADLQAIIDEERASLVGTVLSEVRERLLAGGQAFVGRPRTVAIEPSGYDAGLFIGTIPDQYVPFAFRVVGPEGEEATYDPNLKALRRSPFARFRYIVEGHTLTVLYPYATQTDADTDGTALTVVLATEDEVLSELGAERIAESLDRAVERAHRMMKRRIAEMERQDNYEPAEE